MPSRRSILATLFVGCLALVSPASATAKSEAVYEALFRRLGDANRTFVLLAWPLDASDLMSSDGLLALEFPRRQVRHRPGDFGAVRVRLVSDAEYVEVFSDERGCRGGWVEFHRRFPEAKVLIRLSAVSFSANGRTADVLVQVGSDCFGGTIDKFTFVNSDSGWRFALRENLGRS
jgi:hypothetical protein